MKQGLFALFQRFRIPHSNCLLSLTKRLHCNSHFSELGEPSALVKCNWKWNQEVQVDSSVKSWIKWSIGISTAQSAARYNPEQAKADVGRVTWTESWILISICRGELAEGGLSKLGKYHGMILLCLSSRRLLQHVEMLRANWAVLYPSSCLRISLRLLTQWADLISLLPKIPYQWIIPLQSWSSRVGYHAPWHKWLCQNSALIDCSVSKILVKVAGHISNLTYLSFFLAPETCKDTN